MLYLLYIGAPSFSLRELLGYPLNDINSRPSREYPLRPSPPTKNLSNGYPSSSLYADKNPNSK